LICISGVLQAARLSINRYPFESRTGKELILDIQGACGTLRFRPEKSISYRYRAGALGQMRRSEEATAALKQTFAVAPEHFTFYGQNRPPWMRPQDHARLVEGAGLSDHAPLQC
jgi:hypothetical protein